MSYNQKDANMKPLGKVWRDPGTGTRGRVEKERMVSMDDTFLDGRL
jgi:hypothetical protein